MNSDNLTSVDKVPEWAVRLDVPPPPDPLYVDETDADRPTQDGPNTHHYRTYERGTSFLVIHTSDVDGVRHSFHVPMEVVQEIDRGSIPGHREMLGQASDTIDRMGRELDVRNSRGAWLGAVLLALALTVGFWAGWLLRGAS